jgi:hypothetical protein
VLPCQRADSSIVPAFVLSEVTIFCSPLYYCAYFLSSYLFLTIKIR